MSHKTEEITFNDQQLLQYSRQIMLPKFGIEGQQKLQNSHIIIIGMGGLGSPCALYLASAGVGELTLVDFDKVEKSNLQRQIIHREKSIGDNKTLSAKKTIKQLNPDTIVNCMTEKLSLPQLCSLFKKASCVVDATDNFNSRFLTNRACVANKVALVSAAAISFEGQISTFDLSQADSACYACLYPEGASEEEATCSDNGILAPVVGILGAMQALEAIKVVSQTGKTLRNRLLLFDALSLQWRTMALKKDKHCPVCRQPNSP